MEDISQIKDLPQNQDAPQTENDVAREFDSYDDDFHENICKQWNGQFLKKLTEKKVKNDIGSNFTSPIEKTSKKKRRKKVEPVITHLSLSKIFISNLSDDFSPFKLCRICTFQHYDTLQLIKYNVLCSNIIFNT